ncbi:hypothetical protein LPJ63_002367 [Coemansia sp. RSA 2711]|nr:hypothetical protein LPJ63_002367 [Coemansia sp. RSA 2711]KAJ2360503.1 hypothetical protein H4S01_005705 [Coemansia sp. RSA 2610]
MLKYVCIALAVLVGEAMAKAAFPMPRLAQSCTKIVVRKDITTLGIDEQQRFFRAVREMHRRGWMDGFGSMHDHISHQVHGNDQFFAWHRRFLRHFESLLQEIDPDVVLPYWNWGTYWQNPLADPVLTANFFGGNGRPGDNCVVEGVEARWGRNYPTKGCLTRKFRYGTSTGSFWPMRAVRDVMKTTKSHAQFRSRIENGAHGIVHLGLGGDFETMWAPVDVLFFLHHATIDKVWAEWQSRDPQRFQNVDGFDAARQPVTADSPMPFYGEDVGSTLVTNGPGYCYVYDDLPAPPAVPRNKPKVMLSMNTAANLTGPVVSPQPQADEEPADDEQPAAEQEAPADEGDAAAERLFVTGHSPDSADAKIADFAAPRPMDQRWLKQGHYDLDEAARMQRLVDGVVAEINAERRLGINAVAI